MESASFLMVHYCKNTVWNDTYSEINKEEQQDVYKMLSNTCAKKMCLTAYWQIVWSTLYVYLWHRFKSAILAIFNFCQNGTFEPVHEIQNFFWPKVFFWSILKMTIRKVFHNTSQGPPNPGFMQEKVQKGDFLKKPSRKLKFFFCSRFKWISRRPGTLN